MNLKTFHFSFFVISLFLCCNMYAQQFTTQGSAVQTGAFTYAIVPDQQSQAGMVTNVYPLNLTQNFSLNFQLNFGPNDAGADGFAFLLSNTCSPQLTIGAGLGVGGIANSLVVEFDTWNNGDPLNDITNDHTGIYADGNLSATGNIMDGSTVPACLIPACGNVEDGEWYNVEIKWEYINTSSQKISILFNGELRATSTRNHIIERFQNKNIVFWSVSAATGLGTNLHQFRVQPQQNNNINACIGKTFTLTAPALGSNYIWTGGSSSATNTATFTAAANGTISCTYADYCGASRTVNFIVTVNENPAVTVNSFTTCEVKPQTITASPSAPGVYAFTWTVPSGVSNPGTVASFQTSKAGDYTVVITNTATGCVSPSASGTVTTIPALQTVFTQVADICKDAIIATLPSTSNNGITGTWSPAFNNQQTTTYTFTPGDAFCALPATMTIKVNDIPSVNLGANRTICKGEIILLDPKSAGFDLSYVWQDGTVPAVYNAILPGNYSVTVSNACGSATGTVRLEETVCKIYIPNAFTPNNDGRNDLFNIIGAQYVKDFKMQVYNRWGQLVFTGTNAFEGWNGTQKGLALDPGTYMYRISFTNIQNNEQRTVKGTLFLLR